jgi:hypothetical protein
MSANSWEDLNILICKSIDAPIGMDHILCMDRFLMQICKSNHGTSIPGIADNFANYSLLSDPIHWSFMQYGAVQTTALTGQGLPFAVLWPRPYFSLMSLFWNNNNPLVLQDMTKEKWPWAFPERVRQILSNMSFENERISWHCQHERMSCCKYRMFFMVACRAGNLAKPFNAKLRLPKGQIHSSFLWFRSDFSINLNSFLSKPGSCTLCIHNQIEDRQPKVSARQVL